MDLSPTWLFILAAVGIALYLAYFRSRRDESQRGSAIPSASISPTGGMPRGAVQRPPKSFGYKGSWIASKGISSEKLAGALHLHDVSQSSWGDGLQRSYDPDGPRGKTYPSFEAAKKAEFSFPETHFIFVSPPVNGWTLAVGQRLAFFESFAFKNIPQDRHPKKLLPFVETLSKEIGTVQYFFTHRVPETHIWIWAESGRIVRAYGYSGAGSARP